MLHSLCSNESQWHFWSLSLFACSAGVLWSHTERMCAHLSGKKKKKDFSSSKQAVQRTAEKLQLIRLTVKHRGLRATFSIFPFAMYIFTNLPYLFWCGWLILAHLFSYFLYYAKVWENRNLNFLYVLYMQQIWLSLKTKACQKLHVCSVGAVALWSRTLRRMLPAAEVWPVVWHSNTSKHTVHRRVCVSACVGWCDIRKNGLHASELIEVICVSHHSDPFPPAGCTWVCWEVWPGNSTTVLPHAGRCGLWKGSTVIHFGLEAIILRPPRKSAPADGLWEPQLKTLPTISTGGHSGPRRDATHTHCVRFFTPFTLK